MGDLESDSGDGGDEDVWWLLLLLLKKDSARERMDDAVSKSCRLSMERMRRVCIRGWVASKEEIVSTMMEMYCSAERWGVARGVVRSSR